MTATVHGSLRGFFGCDIDVAAYRRAHPLTVFPGQTNRWFFGIRPGTKESADEIAAELLSPVDTSWMPGISLPYALRRIGNGYETRVYMVEEKIREAIGGDWEVVQKAQDNDPWIDVGGGDATFYELWFTAPNDAPNEIPWPLIGCVEEADAALAWTEKARYVDPAKRAEEGAKEISDLVQSWQHQSKGPGTSELRTNAPVPGVQKASMLSSSTKRNLTYGAGALVAVGLLWWGLKKS